MAGFKANLGSDLMITSDFGEALVGYYLVKKDLFVVRANTEGCDLFVLDKKGIVFKNRKNKNRMIGIEVKTRQSNSPSFKFDGWNLSYSSKKWNFEPYLSIVTRNEILIIPLYLCKSRKIRTGKRRISLPRIRKLKKNPKFKSKVILLEWKPPELKKN